MQQLKLDGKEASGDYSHEWVQGFEELKNLEKGIALNQFSDEFQKRDPEMEFRVLRRLTETQYHNDNLFDFNPDVQKLNRYSNILPFKHSIVSIKTEDDGEISLKDSYINANYINCVNGIENHIIATQGPLPQSILHFWKMIFQEKVSLIVMLCNLKENGKIQCEQYWPKKIGDTQQYGNLSVKWESSEDLGNNLIKRNLKIVEGAGTDGLAISQIQWQGWPDQGVPLNTDYQIILQMVNMMLDQLDKQNKIVLHCSAGVGRTGTLISLANLMIILKLQKEELAKDPKLIDTKEDSFKISIFGIVRRLREQRWGMVHTSEQYSYLYKFMDQTIKSMFNF